MVVSTRGDDLMLADAPNDHKNPIRIKHATQGPKNMVISSLPLAGFWKKCVLFYSESGNSLLGWTQLKQLVMTVSNCLGGWGLKNMKGSIIDFISVEHMGSYGYGSNFKTWKHDFSPFLAFTIKDFWALIGVPNDLTWPSINWNQQLLWMGQRNPAPVHRWKKSHYL